MAPDTVSERGISVHVNSHSIFSSILSLTLSPIHVFIKDLEVGVKCTWSERLGLLVLFSLQKEGPHRSPALLVVLISCLWPGAGQEETEPDWTREAQAGIRKRWFSEGRAVPGAGSPGQCSPHQAWQGSGSVWTVLWVVRFSVGWSCEEQGPELDDPYGSLSTWDVLWCCEVAVMLSP